MLKLSKFKGMESPRLNSRQIWVLRDLPEVTLARTNKGWQIYAPSGSRIRESGITRQAFRRRRDALQALEMVL